MTTSFLKSWRNSKARCATRATASGSSPLTWKIGAWMLLATSVEYTDERDSDGGVVKPTWLLMTMWTVPPVRYARSCESWRVSKTTPWPAIDASPCTRIGRTENEPMGFRSCLARTMPSSTPLTASRCDGFAARYTGISSPWTPRKVPSVPRWYFTSPEPWTVRGSCVPSNSRKIWP